MYKPRLITLDSGLRIVLAPSKGAATSTALVLVQAGSEYEKKEQNGISHFLEHLAFKGSTHFPEVGRISLELDKLGAQSNAFTGQTHTGYYAKAQSGKTMQILDLITDLFVNPIIDPIEVEKERGVILEEIAMYEDQPQQQVMELLESLLYGDQPAGWPIGGPKKTIKKITPKQVVAYRKARYRAPETVVALAGDFDVRKVRKFLEERFSTLSTKKAVRKKKTKSTSNGPHIKVKKKKTDQAHLALGFHGLAKDDDRRFAMILLSAVLGQGMSSRLFHKVREELGAAYYVGSSPHFSLDHGELVIGTGLALDRVEEVFGAIIDECSRLKEELVSPKELKKARDYVIGHYLMNLESSNSIAMRHAAAVLSRGELENTRSVVAALRKVTNSEIRHLAKKIFTPKNAHLALVSSTGSTAKLKKIINTL